MISKSLIRNLIANGLQPVIVKNEKDENGKLKKQNDFSKYYYDWCKEREEKQLPSSLGSIEELDEMGLTEKEGVEKIVKYSLSVK